MDSTLTPAQRIEEAAARWFFKRDSGDWTAADQAQFDDWLNSATAHRVAYLRLNAGWKQTARMKALGAGVPPGVIPPPGSWGDIRFPGGRDSPVSASQFPTRFSDADAGAVQGNATPARSRRRLALAASILLSLGLGSYFYDAGFFQNNRYSTPIGGLDTVPLTDGSQVVLNTDTRIRVDLTDTERRVELDKGEAFFDVAKDAARPFVVQAGEKRVTAVGTKFSVRRDGNDIRVVVTEGAVRMVTESAVRVVTEGGVRILPPSPRSRGEGRGEESSSTLLKAGSVARTADAETLIRETSAPETEQLLSWRSGYLVFEATLLADAVAEFNRYNAREIVIEDTATAALRIGGNFRSNNTDAFLWLLQSGFPITIEHHTDRIVLTRK